MALVNIAETLVKDRLNELLQDCDCCKCETCFMDMMALALNQVPARYVNTKKGELISRVMNGKMQVSVDVDVACMKAIQMVGSSPRHDDVREEPSMKPVEGNIDDLEEQERQAMMSAQEESKDVSIEKEPPAEPAVLEIKTPPAGKSEGQSEAESQQVLEDPVAEEDKPAAKSKPKSTKTAAKKTAAKKTPAKEKKSDEAAPE